MSTRLGGGVYHIPIVRCCCCCLAVGGGVIMLAGGRGGVRGGL
jgi:hypothetical protein